MSFDFKTEGRLQRHRVRAHAHGTGSRPQPEGGRRSPDTARLCGRGSCPGPIVTDRPAIVAHVATWRADAAEHGHALGPAELPGQEAGRHPPKQPLRALLCRLRLASNGKLSCQCISDDCLDLFGEVFTQHPFEKAAVVGARSARDVPACAPNATEATPSRQISFPSASIQFGSLGCSQ